MIPTLIKNPGEQGLRQQLEQGAVFLPAIHQRIDLHGKHGHSFSKAKVTVK